MLTVQDINKITDPVERRKLKIQIIQREQRKELSKAIQRFTGRAIREEKTQSVQPPQRSPQDS